MKRDNHYLAWGLTAVCSVCAILLFYDLVFRSSIVMQYVEKLVRILAPVLYGFAMAYLLSPVVNWFEFKLLGRKEGAAPGRLMRGISILLTWLVMLVLLYGLMSILLPELYKSVLQLINNVDGYYRTVENWVVGLMEDNPNFAERAKEVFNAYYRDALNWLGEKIVPQLETAVQAVTGGVVGLVVFLKNLLIGVIVSIYLMGTKESFAATGSKICYALFERERAAWLIRGVKQVHRIFGGFIGGKLLDSLIIGILCFIFSTWFKFPYAPLVSLVVGVTNVIPVFGPFLGAIPSAFLILLDSPIKCFYFVLFVLALQQFDGNILGPKILGDSTGLSSFWVIVSILVGGGLWGVLGMFLGVPVFACIYTGLRNYAAYRLRKRGLPETSACYTTHEPVWPEESEEKTE